VPARVGGRRLGVSCTGVYRQPLQAIKGRPGLNQGRDPAAQAEIRSGRSEGSTVLCEGGQVFLENGAGRKAKKTAGYRMCLGRGAGRGTEDLGRRWTRPHRAGPGAVLLLHGRGSLERQGKGGGAGVVASIGNRSKNNKRIIKRKEREAKS